MKRSGKILIVALVVTASAAACSTSRSTQDCVSFCEAASACEFTTQPQMDACFELCDSIEDDVPRLTGELSISKYFNCGQSTSCNEFFQCKKNVDDAYDFLFEDGDADAEMEDVENTETESENKQ